MSEKSASEGQTRQKSARRRSLQGVNEYFEPIFNAVWPSIASFRTEPSTPRGLRPMGQCQCHYPDALPEALLPSGGAGVTRWTPLKTQQSSRNIRKILVSASCRASGSW
ncbi:hypothetical protein C1H69_19620 [Billgrantia endophytica]|uniref:Uncharacterized protein n=1 Tax=Billgrantia endophytica TaxID=2033802 RepID=A0A2N7TXE1_9GAMM|nr:hypothetical protein C1H69_19620 [Halomonas endophytica]